MPIYRINRKATRLRDSSFPDTIIFAAANDGAAGAIAAIFEANLAGQQVSLTKAYKRDDVEEAHPVGTRHSLKAYTLTALNQVYRLNARNVANDTTPDHIAALLLGTAGPITGPVVDALGAPPKQPTSHGVITVVQATITTLR